MKQVVRLSAIAVVVALLWTGAAHAQTDTPATAVNGLLDTVLAAANSWDARLRGYATHLFWMLAVMQLVLTFIPLLLRSADLGEIVGEMVRYVLTTGFFAAVLNLSNVWSAAIVDSFREAGAIASGLADHALRPGDMFQLGMRLGAVVLDAMGYNPFTGIFTAVAGIVIGLAFAFMTALMAVTLVESYIVINAAVLFAGLGASQWTREYTTTILRYAVSVGAKLFILELIVGLVLKSAETWEASYTADSASTLTLVGLALTCAYLTKTIPDIIQGLISGTSLGSGHGLGSMASIGAFAATGGAPALVSAAGAVGGATGSFLGKMIGGSPVGGAEGLAEALASSSVRPASMGNAGGGSQALGGCGADPLADQRTGGSGASAAPMGPAPNWAGGAAAKSAEPMARGTGLGGSSDAPGGGQGTGRQSAKSVTADSTGSFGGKLHKAADVAVRTFGTLAALSVPGMESAASLSLAPRAPRARKENADEDRDDAWGAPSASGDGGENPTDNVISAAATAGAEAGATPMSDVPASRAGSAPAAAAASASLTASGAVNAPDMPVTTASMADEAAGVSPVPEESTHQASSAPKPTAASADAIGSDPTDKANTANTPNTPNTATRSDPSLTGAKDGKPDNGTSREKP